MSPVKTGGTGDNVGFGRTDVALRQDSEHGVTDAVEILVFLIWQLPHWLLFGCKNSQKEAGRLFHAPGHMDAERLLCKIR